MSDIRITLTVKEGDSRENATRIAIARLIGWFTDAALEDHKGDAKPGALLLWNVEQATPAPVAPVATNGRR